MIKETIKIIIVGTLFFSLGATANAVDKESSSEPLISTKEGRLINLAGKQRMLSQRMAKDYFYAGKKINRGKALKQLKQSLVHFQRTQKRLNTEIKDAEIINLIAFVDMSLEEFNILSKEKYSIDNGTIILDLSESLLEGSDYIVQALTKDKVLNETIDMAGKQRMLSQRIAKYYIAYQAGIKDDNTIIQMQESVKEFNSILQKLMANKDNTKEIEDELKKVDKMWKIVYKFYLNIKKGGLPKIVFSTTDDITDKMNSIVAMYVASGR